MNKFTEVILAISLIIVGVCCVDLDGTIQISKEEFNTLKESLNRLERFAENQVEINTRLESDLEHQRDHIESLRNIIKKQAEQIQRHENLQQQTNKVSRKGVSINNGHANHITKRHTTNTVAFFATLTNAYLDHLGLHQNIIFEDVVTNIGNGYNGHQGTFVAPVSGLYLITTSVLSRQDKEYWAAVVVNGTEIVRLNGRGTDGDMEQGHKQ